MLAHALTLCIFDDGFDCLIAFFTPKLGFSSVFFRRFQIFKLKNFAHQNNE